MHRSEREHRIFGIFCLLFFPQEFTMHRLMVKHLLRTNVVASISAGKPEKIFLGVL